MNMQMRPPLTKAEQSLSDLYGTIAHSLPGGENTRSLRDRLIGEVISDGLPTRRVESWHYTDLRSLLKIVPAIEQTGHASAGQPLIEGSAQVVSESGSIATAAMPDGVSLSVLRDGLRDETLLPDLEPRGDDDAIGRLNGALVSDGAVLEIAADAEIDRPVELLFERGAGHLHLRNQANFGAKSAATIIERHVSSGAADSLVSAVNQVRLGEGANVTWIVLQEGGETDTHFGQINVDLAADAQLTLYVVNAGGKLVREEVHVETAGSGADFKLRGVNLLGGDSHTDITMTLGHTVPDTTSTQIIRNVVFDRAQGVFQGQIRVAPIAQKTDARMACNTLLLSDDGGFSTKPELEIFADDVQCAHGATVTDFDKNQLFYLRARGISEKQAQALLVNAFVAEIVEELEDEALVDAIEVIISNWLERHT